MVKSFAKDQFFIQDYKYMEVIKNNSIDEIPNQVLYRFNNSIGDDYDLFKLVCDYHDEFQFETIKQINNHFGNALQLNILEIGFGTGITSLKILDQTNSKLVGIDNEPKMLEKRLIL
jgi:ubiquinone/menaquinone biosynthesis C-methylase UbiE